MADTKPIDPQTECLLHLRHAALHLADALAIAEALPNQGNLYPELKDALGITRQSIASLQRRIALTVKVESKLQPERTLEIERDLQFEQALTRR